MSRRILAALVCTLMIMVVAVPGICQNPSDTADETGDSTEPTSKIKRISISLFGGLNSGGTFYDLPILDERAQLYENSNIVYLFNGETLNLGEELTVDGLTATVQVTDLPLAQRELLRLAVAADLTLERYELVKPTLEDVFLRIVA